MSFVKRGDGKILSVVEENDLDDMQKKTVKKVSEQKSQIDKTDQTKKLES